MSAQVDHDLLADYVGGALEGTPAEREVATLIETSPQWRRAADELTAAFTAVSSDLAELLAEPIEPMPADVADRLDAALAPKDPLEPRLIKRESGTRAPRTRWKKWAAPVAVAAAVLGFFAFNNLTSLSTPMTAQQDESVAGMSGEKGPAAPAMASAVPTATTNRSYTRETVAMPMPSAGTAFKSGAEGSMNRSHGGSQPPSPFDLQRCLNAVAVVLPGRVTFVEFANFESRPAVVISITSVGQNWRFVAGYACGQPGPDELFKTPLK